MLLHLLPNAMRKVCTNYEENVGIHADLKYSVERWISGIEKTVQTKAFLAHCKKKNRRKSLLKFRSDLDTFFCCFRKARRP